MRGESEAPPSMTEEAIEALQTASAALQTHNLAAIAAGVALLLVGWLLYRMVLAGAGLVLGGAAGAGAGNLIANMMEIEGAWALLAMGCCAVLGAVVGVVLFRTLHLVAFFLFGAAIGGWIWVEVYFQLGEHGVVESFDWFMFLLWLSVSCVSAGLVFAAFNQHVIAIASALIGSVLVVGGLGWPWYGTPAVPIFLAGLWIQLKLARNLPVEEDA